MPNLNLSGLDLVTLLGYLAVMALMGSVVFTSQR